MLGGGGGGGVSHPLQLTTGLVINSSVTTSPTLAGEHMLLIPKVSILSEQISTIGMPHRRKILSNILRSYHILLHHCSIHSMAISFAAFRSISVQVGPSGQPQSMWSMVCGVSPQGHSALAV